MPAGRGPSRLCLGFPPNAYDTNGSDESALLSMLFFRPPFRFLAFFGVAAFFTVRAAAETRRLAALVAIFALVFILLTVDRFRLRAMCISKNHIEVKSDGTTRANGTWFH